MTTIVNSLVTVETSVVRTASVLMHAQLHSVLLLQLQEDMCVYVLIRSLQSALQQCQNIAQLTLCLCPSAMPVVCT